MPSSFLQAKGCYCFYSNQNYFIKDILKLMLYYLMQNPVLYYFKITFNELTFNHLTDSEINSPVLLFLI